MRVLGEYPTQGTTYILTEYLRLPYNTPLEVTRLDSLLLRANLSKYLTGLITIFGV